MAFILGENRPDKSTLQRQQYERIGNSIGDALQRLTHHKLTQMEQQQAAKGLQALSQLKGQQITPDVAEYLSRSPQLQQQYVKSVFNPKTNQQLTPQQKTHNDKINGEYSNYEGIINTAKNVLDLLENDEVELGYLANKQAEYYPTSLGIPTQAFIGDAGHIYNLRTENLKGQPSKMRLEKLERDKLSPNLSKEENIRRAKRMIKEAEHGVKVLRSSYPQHNFVSSFNESNAEMGNQESQYEVGSIIDEMPQPGTKEFYSLPDGYGFEKNGIVFRKMGNGYQQE